MELDLFCSFMSCNYDNELIVLGCITVIICFLFLLLSSLSFYCLTNTATAKHLPSVEEEDDMMTIVKNGCGGRGEGEDDTMDEVQKIWWKAVNHPVVWKKYAMLESTVVSRYWEAMDRIE